MNINALSFVIVGAFVGACLGPSESSAPDDLTSVDGLEHTIDFDAFVDVAPGASDDVARSVIHRQLKSALGALREQGIGVADRDAQRNLASMQLQRARKTLAGGGEVDRIRYHYRDVALVERTQLPNGPIDLTLLFGPPVSAHAARQATRTARHRDPAVGDAARLLHRRSEAAEHHLERRRALDRRRNRLPCGGRHQRRRAVGWVVMETGVDADGGQHPVRAPTIRCVR